MFLKDGQRPPAYNKRHHKMPEHLRKEGWVPIPDTQLCPFDHPDRKNLSILERVGIAIHDPMGDMTLFCHRFPLDEGPDFYLRHYEEYDTYEFLIHETTAQNDRNPGRGIPFAYAVAAYEFARRFFEGNGYTVTEDATYAYEQGVSFIFRKPK